MDGAALHLFVDDLPTGAVFVDGPRLWFNRAAAQITGYSPGEITTLQDWLARLFPDRAQTMQQLYEPHCSAAFGPPCVVPVLRKDGETRYVEFAAANGAFGEIWLMRDVTDTARLTRLHQQTQQHAGIGGWEFDCGKQSFYWSAETNLLLDRPEDACTLSLAEAFGHFTPSSRTVLEDALRDACERGIAFDLELDAVTARGRGRTMLCRCQVETEKDNAFRLLGWFQDITERKEIERARKLLETQVRQAQKLEGLGVLAGGIAHDFNNLLTIILGYTSLARMELPAQTHLHDYLREVEKASLRAADLTQQMLAYSGQGRMVLAPVDVSHLLRELQPTLEATVGNRARLLLDLVATLPLLDGDAAQLRQAVVGLVSNAAEAMEKPDGAITVRTAAVFVSEPQQVSSLAPPDMPPGWFVSLKVEDNGAGMSHDVLERMFDPFFSTKFTGRGLGMAAVFGIVKAHHGLVRASSVPGHGTTVELLFLAPPVQSEDARTRPALSTPRPTLLVVDDEEAILRLARHVLQSAGYVVLSASDGVEAEIILRQHAQRVHAVLLDLTMPHRSAEETFDALRRIDPSLPILLMSGYSSQEVSRRFPENGYSGFLQKPFAREELLSFVERHLSWATKA